MENGSIPHCHDDRFHTLSFYHSYFAAVNTPQTIHVAIDQDIRCTAYCA